MMLIRSLLKPAAMNLGDVSKMSLDNISVCNIFICYEFTDLCISRFDNHMARAKTNSIALCDYSYHFLIQ